MNHFDFDSIYTARELCRTRGILNTEVTRKEVAYSWVRSQLNNVNYKEIDRKFFPNNSSGCYHLDYDDLASFYNAVLFIDINGKIIENYAISPDYYLPKGMSLEEKTVGTNGIAMAVNTGVAQVTYQFENYHDHFNWWTIVGIPHYKDDEIDFYIGGIVEEKIFEKDQLVDKLKELSSKILYRHDVVKVKKVNANQNEIGLSITETQHENQNTAEFKNATDLKTDLFLFKNPNDIEHSSKILQYEKTCDVKHQKKSVQLKDQNEIETKNSRFDFENQITAESKKLTTGSQYQNNNDINKSQLHDEFKKMTVSEKSQIRNQNHDTYDSENTPGKILIQNIEANLKKSKNGNKNMLMDNDDFFPDCSEKLIALNSKIRTLSSLNSTILIFGPKGTGKEILARKLHSHKYFDGEKFMSVYCDRITRTGFDEILDRVIHPKEPFSGTLYFENFYCLLAEQQEELIKILDCKLVNNEESQVLQLNNLSLVFSSDRTLAELKENKFVKTGLLNRIAMVSIELPALDQLKDAMDSIVDKIKLQHTQRLGVCEVKFDDELHRFLVENKWHGNLRELDHFIESILYENKNHTIIGLENTRYHVLDRVNKGDTRSLLTVFEAEKKAIEEALFITNWNILKTSKLLEISRSTLYRKMDKYQIVR